MQSFHPQVLLGSVRAQFQTVLGLFSVRFYRPTLQLFQSYFAELVLIVVNFDERFLHHLEYLFLFVLVCVVCALLWRLTLCALISRIRVSVGK